MGMDLRAPKQRFATLMEDIGPTATSQFVVWLDEKVAEFKVNGNMNFDINIDAPRWIRDYSMSVMLSTAAQQYSEKESESEYSRTAERPTPTARRKDPVPQPRPRPRLSRPQSPQLSPAPSESSFGGLSRFSDEQTERGHKRLHQEIDNSVVPRQREFMDIKRERRDDSCQFEQDVDGSSINGAGDGSAGDIVKSEPLSPSHQSYELDDRPHVSDTLRDNTDQNDPQSEVVQTIFTPGASQLVATAASTSSSLQGASGDDSFQEAILLDDSDDSREGNPDDFMRKIIAYESQHNPDDDSMLQESMDEGVAGPSGQGSERLKQDSTGQSTMKRYLHGNMADILAKYLPDGQNHLGLYTAQLQHVDNMSDTVLPGLGQTPGPVRMMSDSGEFTPDEVAAPCPACMQTFQSLSLLKSHLYVHMDDWRKPVLSNTGTNAVSKSLHKMYTFECPICGTKLQGRTYTFLTHMMRHYRAKNYVCKACDQKFAKETSYVAHFAYCGYLASSGRSIQDVESVVSSGHWAN